MSWHQLKHTADGLQLFAIVLGTARLLHLGAQADALLRRAPTFERSKGLVAAENCSGGTRLPTVSAPRPPAPPSLRGAEIQRHWIRRVRRCDPRAYRPLRTTVNAVPEAC